MTMIQQVKLWYSVNDPGGVKLSASQLDRLAVEIEALEKRVKEAEAKKD